MNKFEFAAETREAHGKAAMRRMRRNDDRIPAVVYGADQAAQSISMKHNDVLHTLENEAVYSHILTLTVDGKAQQVVIKDVQRHAYKPKIMHVDFLRVSTKEQITMNVPLHFLGEADAPGVKQGAGVFTKSITDVEIRCLPANLPEFLTIDVAKMTLDETIHLADIQLPTGVEFTTEPDEEHNHPVISLHVPKMAQEDVDAEPAEDASTGAAADSPPESDKS
jgi:large subunit ribosomal protein L25